MVTFNELLAVNGIDPRQVALLRHSGRGRLGVTPHDLWQRADGSLERYQSTQEPGRRIFATMPIWASFVSTPSAETLFVGLHGATPADATAIDWNCPMEGGPPGADRGERSDLFDTEPLEALKEYRGRLKILWGDGNIGWVRYAARNEHAVIGDVDMRPLDAFEASPEGEATWRQQKHVERSSKAARGALAANAARNGGTYACEACDFRHADRALFDAHHPRPLLAGPRLTRTHELQVLCPTCHRRAHTSPNRMLPFGLNELRTWNQNGRP
ncbi:HNH endonuclease [Sphingomonas oryzagri]